MTPKEKALKLCQQFGVTTLFAEDCNDGRTLPLRVAKQCALIAVDEIIKLDYDSLEYYGELSSTDYWNEVKQEIEKL